MRLLKKDYTLQCKAFTSLVLVHLTHVKVFEEEVDVIQIILDTDNRIILCLSMSSFQKYQYLLQI